MTAMRILKVRVDIVNDMGRVANGLPRFEKDVKVPAVENINEANRGNCNVLLLYFILIMEKNEVNLYHNKSMHTNYIFLKQLIF